MLVPNRFNSHVTNQFSFGLIGRFVSDDGGDNTRPPRRTVRTAPPPPHSSSTDGDALTDDESLSDDSRRRRRPSPTTGTMRRYKYVGRKGSAVVSLSHYHSPGYYYNLRLAELRIRTPDPGPPDPHF
jgi:hypothetical protein